MLKCELACNILYMLSIISRKERHTMTRYAIPLSYHFNSDSSKTYTEYFVPFTKTELNTFEFGYSEGKFLKLLPQNDFDLLEWIIRQNDFGGIPDNFYSLISIITPQDLPESYSSINDLSTWTVLSEANLIHYASQEYFSHQMTNDETMESVNTLAQATTISQHELLALKIQTSVLLQSLLAESHVFEHTELFEINGQGKRVVNNFILRVMRFYDTVSRTRNFNELNTDYFNEYKKQQAEYNTVFPEICKPIRTICDLGNIVLDPNTPDEARSAYLDTIHSCMKALIKALWKPFETAFYANQLTKKIVRNSPIQERKTFNSLFEYIIQISDFQDLLGESVDMIYNSVTIFQEHVDDVCSINSVALTGISDWNHYSSYFASSSATSYIRNKYSDGSNNTGGNGGNGDNGNGKGNKGTGCFALLCSNSSKNYFALSGVVEELKPNHGKLQAPVKFIMENILNNVPVPNVDMQVYKYNYAYISPNVDDIRRYTAIIPDMRSQPSQNDYLPNAAEPIPFETFKNEYNPNIDASYYAFTYSCCERKMLAYSGYDTKAIIFSRFAPCWKCQPALFEAKDVRIFAFSTVEDYLTQGTQAAMKLQEYKVEKKVTYSIKII